MSSWSGKEVSYIVSSDHILSFLSSTDSINEVEIPEGALVVEDRRRLYNSMAYKIPKAILKESRILDYNYIEKLLQDGAAVNNEVLNPPLAAAVHTKNAKIVKLLLDSGAKLNERIQSAATWAISKGYTEIANLLFEHGLVLNDRSIQDIIYDITLSDNVDTLKILLEHKIDLSYANYYIIRASAIRGANQVLNILLNTFDIQNMPLETFNAIIESGRFVVVKKLLSKCTKVVLTKSLLFSLVTKGKIAILKAVFKLSGGIDKDSLSQALSKIRNKNSLSLVKFLVKEGADVHYGDEMAIKKAISAMGGIRISLAKALLEYGADIHVENEILLCTAIRSRLIKKTLLLLELGASLNAVSVKILANQIIIGLGGVLNKLLEHGMDVNIGNGILLRTCIRHSRIGTLEKLLAAGATLHHKDNFAFRFVLGKHHFKHTEELLRAYATGKSEEAIPKEITF
jgi:ankyrin repeat protein